VSTGCSDVGPAAVFIAIRECDAASAVALDNDGGAAGFIIRNGLIFTASKFKLNGMADFPSSLVESLAYMIFGHITFVFDDSLEVDVKLLLIITEERNLCVNGTGTDLIDILYSGSENVGWFWNLVRITIKCIISGEKIHVGWFRRREERIERAR
jgi:hypothetical protein